MHILRTPGRVNLIGEHIDYHRLPVLPVAIERAIQAAWLPRGDAKVCLRSLDGYAPAEFLLSNEIPPAPAGHWTNYIRAAAQACVRRWQIRLGMDCEVSSDLPAAAGLSSSSALLVSAALALLKANGLQPDWQELMEVLPDAEHYVGTRGGGMDHAVCLGAQRGCACWVEFAPLRMEPIPIPAGWRFVLMHSLTRAEKSAGLREEYNMRRQGGVTALRRLGLSSFHEAAQPGGSVSLLRGAQRLSELELRCFRHVVTEAARVHEARQALEDADLELFGDVLTRSHESLRDDLRVSCVELDAVVQFALRNGAIGARLTGAGFGGYAVAVVPAEQEERFLGRMHTYYDNMPKRHEFPGYLMKVTASDGALRQ